MLRQILTKIEDRYKVWNYLGLFLDLSFLFLVERAEMNRS